MSGLRKIRDQGPFFLVISFVIEYFSVPPDELLNRYREAIPMTCLDIIKWEANLMVSSGVQFETELSLP